MHAPSHPLRCYLMLLHDCGLCSDSDELLPKNFWGNPPDHPARMRLVLLVESAALEIFQKKARRRREGGGRETGMKSKWYLWRGGANLPCDERSWAMLGKSLQRLLFTSEEISIAFLTMTLFMLILLFVCFFISWWGSPPGREGERASGCRGSLELWPIESFSGPGSRSADEARLNIGNRSWKICTCVEPPPLLLPPRD